MKIFCIGIGGIGMSAIAQILLEKGEDISGSDVCESEITNLLKGKGMNIQTGHKKNNIDKSYDLVIHSEAIPEANPEREKARELNIRQMNYAEALGMISLGKKTIAIAGTHGKTTVTGMLTSILLSSKFDPTIVIGSKIDVLNNTNFRVGNSEWFLAEACEYKNNFSYLTPTILVINNLEPDHLDYFLTEEKYFESFQKLAEKISQKGKLIIFENDFKKINKEKISAQVIILSEESKPNFKLKVPGEHNQHNAFMAYNVGLELGMNSRQIQKGLASFSGTWRRFEYKGEIYGAKIYDDYGHHPTEIHATIQGARELFPDKYLTVVFQPHQFSRTREFFNDFCTAFTGADEVWITDIYKARDTKEDIKSVSAKMLSDRVESVTKKRYVALSEIPEEIQKFGNEGKVFIVMGAGSIHKIFQGLTMNNSEYK